MKELSKSCLIGRIWTPMDSLYFLRRTILLARLQGRDFHISTILLQEFSGIERKNYSWITLIQLP